MTRSAKWTLVIAAVMAVVLGGFIVELRDAGSRNPDGTVATESTTDQARERRDADTAAALAEPRRRADLPPCPTGADEAGPEALRGVVLECAADGTEVDVAAALAGRPAVLNLWAYWCGPCTDELPAMQEYQRRVGPAVTVLTVHQDENEEAALLRLADLGVRLPTVQDGRRQIASALRVPNVMPATVVLGSDGSVAKILPRAFTNADEIEAAVGELQ
ncbi:TlpA family protein disulfide reductase [Mycolicibacterium sp.]|uniref:TlpA family protein disulfide reductase n=1 Tax=Mycolicibacterium sp. TaxID=2320850 RepID=UPI00355D9395